MDKIECENIKEHRIGEDQVFEPEIFFINSYLVFSAMHHINTAEGKDSRNVPVNMVACRGTHYCPIAHFQAINPVVILVKSVVAVLVSYIQNNEAEK
jgi:hypothetical protein